MSHHLDANFLKKHKKTSASDGSGGACLNRHERRQENNSCSHIWQAYLKAESDSGVYNWNKYEALSTTYETGARRTRRGAVFPAGMSLKSPPPKPHEWDLGVADNFQDWRKPYWHNAHHIVPNAVLNEALDEAAAGEHRVVLLVRSGLLGALYNLNAQVNMIILPMGEQVARALGLPRHLIGAQKGGGSEFRSHKNYSHQVRAKVDRVMSDYVKVFDQPAEGHPEDPSELARAKLEECSSEVYEEIKKFGAASPGEPIARMPEELFQ